MIDVFIAYSHFDLAYKDELKKFLRPLLREERISLWDDFDIEAGQDWDARIKERLYGAELVLLLVSADSLASDYFYGKEVKVSLERHARGEAIVVPVILRHCDWAETPLGSLEALPEKGRPVADWPTRDQAFLDVVSRLRRVVESLEIRRKNATAEAEALRQFQAACEAADHLYANKNWREAALAYASAIAAHRPGFLPEKATLQARRADCDAQVTVEQVAEKQRLQAVAAARFAEEKRDKEAVATETQRAKEAEMQRQRAEKERLAQEEREGRAAVAPTTSSTPLIVGIGLGVIIIAMVLLLWHPWSRRNVAAEPTRQQPGTVLPAEDKGRDNKDTQPHQPAVTDTETADFAAAKAAGTIPALNSFIAKKYPREQYEKEANLLLQKLENKVKTLLKDAAQFREDPGTACDLLRQAAAIAPNGTEVLKRQRELKCK